MDTRQIGKAHCVERKYETQKIFSKIYVACLWHLVSHKKAIFQLFRSPSTRQSELNKRTINIEIGDFVRDSLSVAQNMQIQSGGKELHWHDVFASECNA